MSHFYMSTYSLKILLFFICIILIEKNGIPNAKHRSSSNDSRIINSGSKKKDKSRGKNKDSKSKKKSKNRILSKFCTLFTDLTSYIAFEFHI